MNHDLTHPIATGMPVFPGDPEVQVEDALTIASDGCAVRDLHLGTHSGTHVDAPSHTIPGGRTIDRVLPRELTGDAVILHLSELQPGEEITPGHLGDVDLQGGRIVLIATGWDRYWGTGRYPGHPVLGAEACEVLVDAGMHVLGMDTISPDPVDADVLPVHDLLLGGDRLIIENLRGLTELPGRVEFTALPLPVAGGDGSPVRAVASTPPTWTIGEYAFPGQLRDELVGAILDGRKTTTSSLLLEYRQDGDTLPQAGDKEVVVDSGGAPVCVIVKTDVAVCRLDEVTGKHARGEGEGFRDAVEWRSGHEEFWTSREFRAEYPGLTIGDDTQVVCVRFEMVSRLADWQS